MSQPSDWRSRHQAGQQPAHPTVALPGLSPERVVMVARIPKLEDMPEHEHVIRHLENRHPNALHLKFTVEPGRSTRRIHNIDAWIAYHERLHALDASGQYDDHYHRE